MPRRAHHFENHDLEFLGRVALQHLLCDPVYASELVALGLEFQWWVEVLRVLSSY